MKVDGQFYEIADVPPLDKTYKHDIDVVVDRLVVRSDISARLADSLETSLRLADGLAIAEIADKPLPADETPNENSRFIVTRSVNHQIVKRNNRHVSGPIW